MELRGQVAAASGRPGRGGARPVPAQDYFRVRWAREQLGRAAEREAARQERQREQQENEPAPARNVTDPASRLMPVRGGGFVQGYNAQNVTSEDGLVIATRLTASPADTRFYQPLTTAAARQHVGTASLPLAAAQAGAKRKEGDGQRDY